MKGVESGLSLKNGDLGINGMERPRGRLNDRLLVVLMPRDATLS